MLCGIVKANSGNSLWPSFPYHPAHPITTSSCPFCSPNLHFICTSLAIPTELVFYCCCNNYLKFRSIHYLIILEVKSLKCVSLGENRGANRAVSLPDGSKRDSTSLPFPAPRVYLCSSTFRTALHIESQQWYIFLWPSTHTDLPNSPLLPYFSTFKDTCDDIGPIWVISLFIYLPSCLPCRQTSFPKT